MRFLAPDSKFMEGWNNLVDAIWVNIMMIVTSIPIITIGAAISAGNTAERKSLHGEGHVTANYFHAFKENFIYATLLWLVFGASGAALVALWIFVHITELLIIKIALSIVWFIGFEWAFALQARFVNSPVNTLVNAFIFGVSYFPATLALIAIDIVFIGLLVGCWFVMPQGLFLLCVFGYGSMLALHVPIQEYVLRKHGYLKQDKADEEAAQ